MGKYIFALAFVCASVALGQGYGSAFPPGGGATISSYTVATLPLSATPGTLAIVTDASTAGSCTSGGGTALSLCRWSGAAWTTVGGSGGSGTVINTYVVATLPSAPATSTLAVVTDSNPTGSCTVGGGSGHTLCQYTGSVWVTVAPIVAFQVNGTNTTSQAGINLITSTVNGIGLVITPSNPGTDQVKLEITGTINASAVPTLNQPTTANAGTATALAAPPTPCSSGNAPTGVNANGNSTGCTQYFGVANNLSEGNAGTMRSNLGLGTAATVNTGTTGASIPLNNGNNTLSGTDTFTGTVVASGAARTAPTIVVSTAGALPATCTQGDLAFVQGATAGQQIYECSSTNTWTQQLNSGGGAGLGVENAGTLVGTRPTVNYPGGGTCISTAISDTGTVIDITPSVNTALCPPWTGIQDGQGMTLLETSSSSSIYTWTMNPTLTAYPISTCTTGNPCQLPIWSWKVGTTCSGGAITGNEDALGAHSIVNPDGTNPTNTQCAAGQKLQLTYDSVAGKFVIMGGEAPGTGGSGCTPGGSTGAFQKNAGSSNCAGTNVSENSDGSDNASKGFTLAAPYVPTYNVSGTTTCDWSQSNTCILGLTGGTPIAGSTTIAVSNPHGTGPYWILGCMNGTGGYTITYPSTFKSVSGLDPTASACTLVQLTFDGSTNYYGPGTTTAGVLAIGATGTALGTPGSGNLNCWLDSTDNDAECKDSSGNIYKMFRSGVDVNPVNGQVTNGSHITNSSIPNSGLANIAAINYAAGAGSANAQTATYSPAIASLVNGLGVCWLPMAANTTTTPSFAPNGLTAKTITKVAGAALAASDLTTTAIACAIYDGTSWELQNPQTTGSGGGSGGTVVPKTAGYTFVSGDNGNEFTFSGSTLTATLVATPPTMPWIVGIKNINASPLTISRNGNTINGGTSNITLQQYQSVTCASDTVTGANYVCDVPDIAGTNVTLTPAPNGITISSSGGSGASNSVNSQTTTYTATAADFSNFRTIVVPSGTPFNITLVASGSQPPNGQEIHVINYSNNTVTIVANGQNINGTTASLPVVSINGATIKSDGTNYFFQAYGVPPASACSNQVITGLNGPSGGTCTTVTSAYVDSSIAKTGAANTFTAKNVYGAGGMITTNNSFTLGTVTANDLACFTASNTVGNCTGLPSNNVLGVFADTSGNITMTGNVATVALDATGNVAFGDILCGSSTSASVAHDNGTVVCTPGNWVGIVQTTASSVSSATAFLRLQ
jgi:hypothetical protein